MSKPAAAALILLSSLSTLQGQAAPATTGAATVKLVLVELFTSEACSSCPPADALLRRVNGTRTTADQLIVGISEHVTYWNDLGWSDPYSSGTFTDRQNAYSERLRLDGVYTPQMVVNGTEQFVGSDSSGLASALRKEQDRAFPVELRITSMRLAGDALMLAYSASGDASAKGADLFAFLVADTAQSNVRGGENSGRTLSHVAVARALVRVGKLQDGPNQTAKLALPRTLVAPATGHLVLFVQAQRTGSVLGVDFKPLP